MRKLAPVVAALVALAVAPAAAARKPVIAYVDGGTQKLGFYDSETGTTIPAPDIAVPGPIRRFSVSAGGRFVFYADASKKLHLYDRASGGERPLPGIDVYAGSGDTLGGLTVSDSGLVAFDDSSNGPERVYDSNAKAFVGSGLSPDNVHRDGHLSADGRFLATICLSPHCAHDTGGDSDLFVQDLTTLTDTGLPDHAAVDQAHPCISGNGSIVGADETSGAHKRVFLYDRGAATDITPAGLNSTTTDNVNCVLSGGGNFVGRDDNAGHLQVYDRAAAAFLTLPATIEPPVWFTNPYTKPTPTPTPTSGPSPADLAIAGFHTRRGRIDTGFETLYELYLADPAGLRAAALRHLHDPGRPVRYAALYSLALTAAPGPAHDALLPLLRSRDASKRLLAASALAGTGEKAALPVLIAALRSHAGLAYRDPPERGWQLARATLLDFTGKKLGLGKARGSRAVARTRSAWRRWWARHGAALRWDAGTRRYTAGPQAGARLARSLGIRSAAAGAGGANATVKGDTITIEVDIHLFGPAVVHTANGGQSSLDALAQSWEQGAERHWNEAFRSHKFTDSCGRTFNLKLDVKMRAAPTSFRNLDKSDANQILVADLPWVRSANRTPGKGKGDSAASYSTHSNGVWAASVTGTVVAHEVGHLMGLGDDYKDVTGKDGKVHSEPFPGRKGTLMADARGTTRIDQQLIDRLGQLLEKAGKVPKCKPKLRGYKFSGLRMRWDDKCGGSCFLPPKAVAWRRDWLHPARAGDYFTEEFSAHVCGNPYSRSWTGKIHYTSHDSLGDKDTTYGWDPGLSKQDHQFSPSNDFDRITFDAKALRVTMHAKQYVYDEPQSPTTSVPVTEDKSCPKPKG
jgi:hypothetical protein